MRNLTNAPMYDERFVTPMRQELTRLGIEELRTPDEVDARLKDAKGTTLVVVNSICGCAARMARPAVATALQHSRKPANLTTVFAGQDAAGGAHSCRASCTWSRGQTRNYKLAPGSGPGAVHGPPS